MELNEQIGDNKMNKIIIIIMVVLLSGMAFADSGVYDDVNHYENSIYNLTDVNSTNFYGAFVGSSTEWITMASLQSKWFADVGNVLTFNETELNTTIDARDTDTTYTSDETYINLVGTEFDFNETKLNTTIEGYGYSTATGTVTSISTDNNYLTGGDITSTGTITFNETELNTTIDARDTDTTYTAGAGLTLTTTAFSVTADGIGDTQLAYNTGQALTTTSEVTFDEANLVSALTLYNNIWLRSANVADDGFINMFKVNTDDIIEAGANISIGTIKIVEDSGVINLIDMSVSATPIAGTDEGYNFSVDGEPFLKIFADADSAGSITNKTIWVDDDISVKFDNGASIVVNSTCIIMNSPAGTGILNVCD